MTDLAQVMRARASKAIEALYAELSDEDRDELDFFARLEGEEAHAHLLPDPDHVDVLWVRYGGRVVGALSTMYLIRGVEPDVWPPAWYHDGYVPPLVSDDDGPVS